MRFAVGVDSALCELWCNRLALKLARCTEFILAHAIAAAEHNRLANKPLNASVFYLRRVAFKDLPGHLFVNFAAFGKEIDELCGACEPCNTARFDGCVIRPEECRVELWLRANSRAKCFG